MALEAQTPKIEEGDITESEDCEEGSSEEDVVPHEYEPVEESVYGWAVSMIIRDFVWLRVGTSVPGQRAARVFDAILLVVGLLGLQIFLLLAVSRLLSGPAVYAIRETYSAYEELMYPNHTQLTVNGFKRGIPGHLVEERFLLMSNSTAHEVCEIPLSHPWYLMAVIFIWTLTCQVELRNIFETSVRLLWKTPTVPSEVDVLGRMDEEQGARVEGLTLAMKLVVGPLLQLPRALMLVTLLYLGCRWLTATLGLGDVLLNGLALEFLVVLKDMLYSVCSSHRARVDTQRLYIKPFRDVSVPGVATFFGGKIWGILAALWAFTYVFYLQSVLPDYRWDLREPCTKNIPMGPLF